MAGDIYPVLRGDGGASQNVSDLQLQFFNLVGTPSLKLINDQFLRYGFVRLLLQREMLTYNIAVLPWMGDSWELCDQRSDKTWKPLPRPLLTF